jgi:hypothetical protein
MKTTTVGTAISTAALAANLFTAALPRAEAQVVVTDMGRITQNPQGAPGIDPPGAPGMPVQPNGSSVGVVFMDNAVVNTAVPVTPGRVSFVGLYYEYALNAPRDPSQSSFLLNIRPEPTFNNSAGTLNSTVQPGDPFQFSFNPGDARVSYQAFGAPVTLGADTAKPYLITIDMSSAFTAENTPFYQASTLVSMIIAPGGGIQMSSAAGYSPGYINNFDMYGDSNFHTFPINPYGNTLAIGYEYTVHPAVVPEPKDMGLVGGALLAGYALYRSRSRR